MIFRRGVIARNNIFPIEYVFLFGSFVNASFKPYSDIDVVN
ncbi:nucleotidyltransferase domain-containing protein [Marinomonas spartinae]